jgi:hypothetical protein
MGTGVRRESGPMRALTWTEPPWPEILSRGV